jgi:DNA-binding transcriptional MocR family regulator
MEVALTSGQFTSAAERQARLIDCLRTEVFADAQKLKDALGVSIATIRRDLNELEARGLLKRTHGGAAIINQVTRDYMTPIREVTNATQREEPHWSSDGGTRGGRRRRDNRQRHHLAPGREAAGGARIPDLRHQRHRHARRADGRRCAQYPFHRR